ncbi:hypothetical protein BDD12DRAFT_869558 [Trichophaea hybrida]|nr:hypothetical protein BDD12DRAFT_869558 [Trichophaea hybrida]
MAGRTGRRQNRPSRPSISMTAGWPAVIYSPQPSSGGYKNILISDRRNRLGDDIIQASECLKS